MTDEELWTLSFVFLPDARKIEILFDFLYRGLDGRWFPAWRQMLEWPDRDPDYEHAAAHLSHISQELVTGIALWPAPTSSFIIPNVWTLSHAVIGSAENFEDYEVTLGDGLLIGFDSPYRYQEPIITPGQKLVCTLVTLEVGPRHNWLVCEESSYGDSEIRVLKKRALLRTDSCSEILAGLHNVMPMLEQVHCMFV